MKIVKKKNQTKIIILTAAKNCCILHGRVFVMWSNCYVAAFGVTSRKKARNGKEVVEVVKRFRCHTEVHGYNTRLTALLVKCIT